MYTNHGTNSLGNASHRFWTQDITTPGHTSYLIISVIVVGLDSLHQLCKSTLILPVGDSCISLEHQFPIFYKSFVLELNSS
uniref:Uncharacterized protein n=1 Tax=Phasianus colchicus TaxID=9054 RepID=A0A669QPZ0_PHACC